MGTVSDQGRAAEALSRAGPYLCRYRVTDDANRACNGEREQVFGRERGLKIARAQGNAGGEALASLVLARVLLGFGGPAAREEIEAALARAFELARDTEAKALEPLVHVELAELDRQNGDEEGCERELREAHRLFTEIGASGHAERLELELPNVI